MKDLHQIGLIKRMHEDPIPFIGQRAFKLWMAYLQPFDLFCDFDVPSSDIILLEKYPSIREEIERIYHLDLGTRGWWSPLKYYCEDERAHFELALSFILDYEKKYPNPNQSDYRLKLKNPEENPDLSTWLGHIGFRPEMFFGTSELACLRAFVDGYFFFKDSFGLQHSDFELKLLEFIKLHKVDGNRDFKTWDRNYRWEWDFAVYGSNERHAIPRFIKDIEEFSKVELNIMINDAEVKLDWANYQDWWNKSANDLLEESKA